MKPHEWLWAIRDTPLDRSCKNVGWALASRMNRRGVCWPSKATVADDCGYTIRTVDRAVIRLELSGLLTVRRRPPAPNLYTAVRPRNGYGVTPQFTTPDPVMVTGEEYEEDIEEFAYAIQVDEQMLRLAHGWLDALTVGYDKAAMLGEPSASRRSIAADRMIEQSPVRLTVVVGRSVGLPFRDVPRKAHQGQVVASEKPRSVSPVDSHPRKVDLWVRHDLLPAGRKPSGFAMGTRIVRLPGDAHLASKPFDLHSGQPNVVLERRAGMQALVALNPHVMSKDGLSPTFPAVLSLVNLGCLENTDHAVRIAPFQGGSTLKTTHREDAPTAATDRCWQVRIDQRRPLEISNGPQGFTVDDQERLPRAERLALAEADGGEFGYAHRENSRPAQRGRKPTTPTGRALL